MWPATIFLTFSFFAASGAASFQTPQKGFCVLSNGWDQNSGVIKLDSGDGYSAERQRACFEKCKAYPASTKTGCELIWQLGNRGCYLHTQTVAKGNGVDRHFCWINDFKAECNSPKTTNPPESSRTYSSVWNNDPIGTRHARSMLDSPQAWSAKYNRAGEWMQIDLGKLMDVGGVVIQGRGDAWRAQKVTSCRVETSTDGQSWVRAGTAGLGLTNFPPRRARFVKFVVASWESHISMRAAVRTCGSPSQPGLLRDCSDLANHKASMSKLASGVALQVNVFPFKTYPNFSVEVTCRQGADGKIATLLKVDPQDNFSLNAHERLKDIYGHSCVWNPKWWQLQANWDAAGRTEFSFYTLVVDRTTNQVSIGTGDEAFQFAEQFHSSTAKNIAPASGGSCYSWSACSMAKRGKFNIDLTGTGLILDKSVTWKAEGWGNGVQKVVDFERTDHTASGKCGAWCGSCKPAGDLIVAPDPSFTEPEPPSGGACVPPANLDKITCPVMTALVKNCDLEPDADGFVTKQQTLDAMIRVGISVHASEAAANNNFDHLPEPKRLNLFKMNTITAKTGGNSKTEALEHFRSTGIRDANGKSAVNTGILDEFLSKAKNGKFTLLETLQATSIWDTDFMSNDVNVDLRPSAGCTPTSSTKISVNANGTPNLAAITADKCFSGLHGSILAMHQEFGTPQGAAAVISKNEMRALWLHGTYPAGFAARKPAAIASFVGTHNPVFDLGFGLPGKIGLGLLPGKIALDPSFSTAAGPTELTGDRVRDNFKKALGVRRRVEEKDEGRILEDAVKSDLVSRLLA